MQQTPLFPVPLTDTVPHHKKLIAANQNNVSTIYGNYSKIPVHKLDLSQVHAYNNAKMKETNSIDEDSFISGIESIRPLAPIHSVGSIKAMYRERNKQDDKKTINKHMMKHRRHVDNLILLNNQITTEKLRKIKSRTRSSILSNDSVHSLQSRSSVASIIEDSNADEVLKEDCCSPCNTVKLDSLSFARVFFV